MRALAIGGLALAFLSLAATAALGHPAWRYALVATMVAAALGLCGAVGLIIARVAQRSGRPLRLSLTGITVGVAAALTRQLFLSWVQERAAEAAPQIRLTALAAAVFSVVGGAFALWCGCAALRLMAATGDPETPSGRTWPGAVAGGAAVALGLYGISPLGQALGIRVNHWTFLGLVALAVVAYGIDAGIARLGRPRHGAGRRPRPRR